MKHNQFAERVFDTANGLLVEEACVKDVKNLFISDTVCAKLYREMAMSRERLAERTGLEEDDENIEGIISPLLEINRIVGIKMFEYGLELAKKAKNL